MSNNPYAVQFLRYSSRGGYVCYPKVTSNDRTWDSRSLSDWKKWTLDIDGSKTVDLINDAGFSENDVVIAGIDVVAGKDASCDKMFTVSQNKATANLDASGTTPNSHLKYTGTT